VPGSDPNDWLHRLTTDEWLAAAATELTHVEETLVRRAYRPAVTHARRAAGMALNAVLTLRARPAWGRSYMEHVVALVDDAEIPDTPRAAARTLRETPAAPPELVPLGKPDTTTLEAARAIVAWARAEVAALRQRPS
jgi:HEPN domain-containing protein